MSHTDREIPILKSFGQTKFHLGGRKSSIQCICSTKQNPVEKHPTILWKSSVVQKTLAALPITCLKPDDAAMEKMLWISTGNFNHHNQSLWVSSTTFISVNGCFSINGISTFWRPYRFRVLVCVKYLMGISLFVKFTSGSLCGHWSKLLLIIITLLSVCIFCLRKKYTSKLNI